MVPASAECVLWRCGGHARNWYDVVVGDLVDLGCSTGSGLGGKSKRTRECDNMGLSPIWNFGKRK
eukprot:4421273-Ditylum_brightwellii.AAC.1